MRQFDSFMRYLLILFFLFGLLGNNVTVAQPKREVRAVWLATAYGLDWPRKTAIGKAGIRRQQKELCDMLDKLSEAHFNTVIFQTRLRGDVAYPSSIEPYNEVFSGQNGRSPGYDPLAFAIEECHKRGMELHAWVVAIPLGSNKHVRSLGKASVVRKHPNLCLNYKGEWFLNPGEPGTANYLSSLVDEIVRQYDVDGIHLDYIRYPDRPATSPDRDAFRRYGKGQSLSDWRRANVTSIVRQIYHAVKKRKPWVKVSSAPVGKFRDTSRYSSFGWNGFHAVYQDAQGWLKEGIQDMLFPMMYFKDNQFYPFALDWQENACGRPIVPGLGVYFLHPSEKNWKLGDVEREICFIRRHGLAGQAYYRARFVTGNTKRLWTVLYQDYYNYPALPALISGRDMYRPSAPTGLEVEDDGSICTLRWNSEADSIHYYIYASNDYPVNVDDASNLLATRVAGDGYRHMYLYPDCRKRYYAVTAVDRYGSESEALQMSDEGVGRWLRSDGQMLHLPPWWQADFVTVADLCGRSVMGMPYEQDMLLDDRLPGGWYRVLVSAGERIIYTSLLYISKGS